MPALFLPFPFLEDFPFPFAFCRPFLSAASPFLSRYLRPSSSDVYPVPPFHCCILACTSRHSINFPCCALSLSLCPSRIFVRVSVRSLLYLPKRLDNWWYSSSLLVIFKYLPGVLRPRIFPVFEISSNLLNHISHPLLPWIAYTSLSDSQLLPIVYP